MNPDSILDSVEIPSEYVGLCSRWYDGSGSMMYAVASTGNLARGSIRPIESDGYWQEYPRQWIDTSRPMTDLEWYRSIFSGLSSDVMWSIRVAEKSDDPDAIADIDELHNFDAWIDRVIARIDLEIEREESSAHN